MKTMKKTVYIAPSVSVAEVRTRVTILAGSIQNTSGADGLGTGGNVGDDPEDPFDAGGRRAIRQPNAWKEW